MKDEALATALGREREVDNRTNAVSKFFEGASGM